LPLEHIGKERESLTVNSEEYKKQFLKYLQARQYYNVKASSDVEGTFADVILTRKNEKREYWLEIKATEVSLGDGDFLNQLAKYLSAYLSIPTGRRFKLILACYKLIDRDLFKSVFEYLEDDDIEKLKRDILKNAEPHARTVIEDASSDEIREFFADTTVKEADMKALEFAEAKVSPRPPQKPSISETEYAASVIANYGDVSPLQERERLYLNLYSVELPSKLFVAKSVFATATEMYEDMHTTFPPHEFKDGEIFTFQQIDCENPLFSAILPSTVRYLETSEFTEDEKNLAILRIIVNRWIREKCEELNLQFDKRTKAFYYHRKLSEPGIVTAKWKPTVRTSTRELTRPMKSSDGKIKYWVHRGARVFATIFRGKLYVQIRPRFLFSWNGLILMEGEDADLKDRKFRKSIYNRNANQLYDVRFWFRHVFPESSDSGIISLTAYIDPKYSQSLKLTEQESIECQCRPNEDKTIDVEALDSINANSEQLSDYLEED
jgi:hypothetical protein